MRIRFIRRNATDMLCQLEISLSELRKQKGNDVAALECIRQAQRLLQEAQSDLAVALRLQNQASDANRRAVMCELSVGNSVLPHSFVMTLSTLALALWK